MKTIDKSKVLVAAVSLMVKQGSATSLEVKNELRKNGYNARQAEVRDLLNDLRQEESWNVSDNGTFKIYTPKTNSFKPTSPSSVAKTSSTATILTAPAKGCWEVNATTGSKVVYVNGSVTRSAARYAFVKNVPGTDYADTRSRKIK